MMHSRHIGHFVVAVPHGIGRGHVVMMVVRGGSRHVHCVHVIHIVHMIHVHRVVCSSHVYGQLWLYEFILK